MDNNCCNSKPGGHEPNNGIVYGGLMKMVDLILVIRRIGREVKAEQLQDANFLKQLPFAIFLICHENLENARKKTGLVVSAAK